MSKLGRTLIVSNDCNSVSPEKLDLKMSQNRDMDRKVVDFSNILEKLIK